MKGLSTHEGGPLALRADRQQQPAVEIVLANRVGTVVGEENSVVRRHMDTMRPLELSLTP